MNATKSTDKYHIPFVRFISIFYLHDQILAKVQQDELFFLPTASSYVLHFLPNPYNQCFTYLLWVPLITLNQEEWCNDIFYSIWKKNDDKVKSPN